VQNRESDTDDMYIKVQAREVYCLMMIADAKVNKHLYIRTLLNDTMNGEKI
jgi:hypothetical protein